MHACYKRKDTIMLKKKLIKRLSYVEVQKNVDLCGSMGKEKNRFLVLVLTPTTVSLYTTISKVKSNISHNIRPKFFIQIL